MAYAYSDESNKHLKVNFHSDHVNRCPSSSCYTSSSRSSSSRSSLHDWDEPYDIEKADVGLFTEATKPGLIEPPAPAPSPDISPQTTVYSSESSSQSLQIPLASGRPSGYDPNRLPPAIFAAKPSSAMDWSEASNESLFSIHVGNSSFSKDQFLVMLNKSGDLGRIDEIHLNAPTPLSPVTETLETKPSLQTLEIDSHSVETESVETRSEISEDENFDINIVTGNVEKDEETRDTVRLPTLEENKGRTISHRSSESNHSNQSFQFPVLVGHHDHRYHVEHPLHQVKEEKQAMRAPEKQHYQPDARSPPEKNAPLKATESGSCWWSCFSCCCIC
ncbi:uncharacterized protein LOC126797379 [Argentina anserina]|uniref:uncharacterized protein LOC126797379 n=1 Tax=Argentina anserina TaxID=57926 RepID=UPI00217630D5|nr:uncharacterized protein LOC126797379 [Potentilla anserina]